MRFCDAYASPGVSAQLSSTRAADRGAAAWSAPVSMKLTHDLALRHRAGLGQERPVLGQRRIRRASDIQASRGGLGFGGFAPSVSWNSATPDKQEPWTFGSCVSFDFGLCGAIGGRSPYKYNSSNPSDRHHWYSVGVTGGEGASLGGSYTWLDWNLGDPLHPTIFGCHPFGR